MTQTAWLARRATMALALMIGFYALGIGMAAALLWIPYAELAYLNHVTPKIAGFCVLTAGAILWALVPRPDRFEAPGPRLDEQNAPGLFIVVRDIAGKTGQEMPADAYLLTDANAFVTYRGGIMGIGSRRVLGIGLPLFHALSVAELTAVIAHEFGHYAAGDVSLGPWIYKTRAAIGRTLEGLKNSLLSAPFRWYAAKFLALTQAVSRQQEFDADALAARVAGRGAMAAGLRRTASLAPVFTAYLDQEVAPAMRAGLLPPIASGFDQFVRADAVQASAHRLAEERLQQDDEDVFDSHPSLRKRLEALGQLTECDREDDREQPASTLLGDPEGLARTIAIQIFGAESVERLKPTSWERVTNEVHLAGWKTVVDSESAWLSQFTADGIPAGAEALLARLPDWRLENGIRPAEEDRLGRALYTLGAAVGLVLRDAGWTADSGPGRGIGFVRGDDVFDPRNAIADVITEHVSSAQWTETCDWAGITGRRLAPAPAADVAGSRPSAPAPPKTPPGFPGFHRPASDPLYELDQLATHPERWAAAPVEALGRLLAFHGESLIRQQWAADTFGIPLWHLHDVLERRATPDERMLIFESVAGMADRMSRNPAFRGAAAVLQPFLYDPDLRLASTAALTIAASHAPSAGDPLSGAKMIAAMASKGLHHKRRATWLAGLAALGEQRVVDVLDGCWRPLSTPALRVLARQELGAYPTQAMAEFYLRWAETAAGDTRAEASLPHALTGLANLAARAERFEEETGTPGVAEVVRALPAWTVPADSVVTVVRRWSKAEFAKVIEPRLRAIADGGQEPRAADQALEAWGLPTRQ